MRIYTMRKLNAFLILAGALAAWGVPSPAADNYVVIVNKANPVNSISASELRKLFLGEKSSWPGGAIVVAVTPRPESPEYNSAIKKATGMPAADFKRYLIQLSFLGKTVPPPRTMASPADIARFVASFPGAISCLPAEAVGPNVKTVKVE